MRHDFSVGDLIFPRPEMQKRDHGLIVGRCQDGSSPFEGGFVVLWSDGEVCSASWNYVTTCYAPARSREKAPVKKWPW